MGTQTLRITRESLFQSAKDSLEEAHQLLAKIDKGVPSVDDYYAVTRAIEQAEEASKMLRDLKGMHHYETARFVFDAPGVHNLEEEEKAA